ncbi:MAG TPA: FAD-binding oxidoreductase [Devosiaceae bacterium]|nr:FAD-binding oxidoreductase [Devosiaceae bacterium]
MTRIETAVAALKTGFSGALLCPGAEGYDAARTVVAGGIDRHPGAIARVRNTADVQRVVEVARETGLELAIRSGGHSNAGHSTTEGGLVLDLREMKAIDVDPTSRTLWAETGATAMEVTQAALRHGLVVGFGDTGSVGIGGLTLGGGVGYLSRKWGLTIDSMLAAEIVTADGTLRTASAEENSELFWALRGGGGNFGVVTRIRFQLNALPAFTGGMLCLPATPETLAGFVAAAEAAPDELSTIANVMPAPPLPFLPKEVVGQTVILAMLAFAGPDDAAAQAIAPFRELAQPYADFVKPGPYTQMFPPENPDYRPTAAARNMFMDRIRIAEARTILETLGASDAPFRVAQIRVLGGAVSRVASDATAYAHRRAPIMVNLAAFWTTTEERPRREAWVDEFVGALTQETQGVYVNFLGAEGPDRVRAAYPGVTWERLSRVKRTFDPSNLFRLNQNISPA